MARIARRGGAARNQRAVLPSSQELLNILSPILSGGTNFAGLPTAASTGEFFEAISVATNQYYDPQSYKDAARRNQAGVAVGSDDFQTFYVDGDGNFVDRNKSRKFYDEEDGELVIPGEKGPQAGESEAAAPLSVVPTSSTNPARPRTVAAGYDRSREVLTVVFRDGTFYNYYEVNPTEWLDFKRRVSKGKYIYQNLDYKPRGPANVRSIPAAARKTLYGLARLNQLKSGGKQKRK
jgi:hypothetical protein